MRKKSLEEMIGGWFVGDFSPSIMSTPTFEVGVKSYKAGMKEPRHVHHLATEITLLVSGRAIMAGAIMKPNDIVRLEPGEESAFEALEDCKLVVIKTPSISNDKEILDK